MAKTKVNTSDAITVEDLNTRKKRRRSLWMTLVVAFLILWAIWSWGFCRFYVAPGKMAVIVSKTGRTMPSGQILASLGEKGILEDVLGEGRHLWNPLFYDWEIHDAQFIPPGKIGIVTSLVGADLPPGEFLAEPGQKGTWKKVLGPGCYRFNPYGYSIEIIDAMGIPLGFAGIVTNQSDAAAQAVPGEDSVAPASAAAGGRGVRKDVLQPGLYYINPRQYKVDAVEVGVNQVSLMGQSGGVILTKSVMADENNQMIQRLNQNVLEEQRRSRQEKYQMAQQPTSAPQQRSSKRDRVMEMMDEDPGEYARGMVMKSLPAPVARATTEGRYREMERNVPAGFIVNQFVNFPSRDAFDISLDMTVEFELQPEHLASIYSSVGDFPDVVAKKIMPGILSVSRNKGSEYRAVDFIAGLGREKFQNELTETLKTALGNDNILIHSALISNVNVPAQILEPLRVTSLSRETDLTNKEKQNTAKKQADLNREMSLIRQSGEQVVQETSKLKAQIQAEMERTVATIRADTLRQMAAIDKQTAEVNASRTVALGRADAESVQMVEEEKAKGFGMKVKAFGGGDYALYEFAMQLNPNMTISLIHAGEGTLWTDLKNASMADVGGVRAIKGK